MAKKYIQYSDIRRIHTLIRTEQGSVADQIRRERRKEAEVQDLVFKPGQKVLDRITGKRGEVLYATRKTVIIPYSGSRGQGGSSGQA